MSGIALIAVGVGFLLKYDDVLDAFKDVHVNVAPIAFIVIGAAIFLIAFFGCCGAVFESECMILTVSKQRGDIATAYATLFPFVFNDAFGFNGFCCWFFYAMYTHTHIKWRIKSQRTYESYEIMIILSINHIDWMQIEKNFSAKKKSPNNAHICVCVNICL